MRGALLTASLTLAALAAGTDWWALNGLRARVLFFVMHDCPISNRYAPEIRRICADYAPRGVDCAIFYVDLTLSDEARRKHQSEFGWTALPVVSDRDQRWVARAGVTKTPEVAVLGPRGTVLYRGRIDDRYPAWGQARREATRHDLRAALDEILAGKPVSVPRTNAVGCYIPPLPLSK